MSSAQQARPKKPAQTQTEVVPTDDPDAVWAWIWQQLGRGTADRRSAFHTPTLATVDEAGLAAPRTVVLQDADADACLLLCHTHRDAAKVAHVTARRQATWHVYDRGKKVQVVLSGPTTVHTGDELAEQRWAAVREFSRACYRRPLPPGVTRPADWPVHEGTGREHFSVVRTQVERVRWLYLHHAGHKGLQFSRDVTAGQKTWSHVELTT